MIQMLAKFKADLACGRVLSRLVQRRLPSHDRAEANPLDVVPGASVPDALVPVPLHWSRTLRRGFNPAAELAVPLAKSMQCRLLLSPLRRNRATVAQSGLDAAERRKNLRGAFRWHSPSPPPQHVVLIDDVVTTGATATECARVLLRSGAKRVDVWAIARAVKG